MRSMRGRSLFWLILPLSLMGGCIQSHRVGYANPAPPTPTSDRPESMVYPGTVTSAERTPPGATVGDLEVAQEVSQLLKTDPHLAAASRNVMVIVKNGVVTLEGTTLAEHDRDEIVERIGLLPGVARVDDRLGLGDER
jgi:hypothetical protein